MDIKFEKGKMTALIGSSGCGKSTIVNLLFRLWDIDKGRVMESGSHEELILNECSYYSLVNEQKQELVLV